MLCKLDPTHPANVSTPIAKDLDSYTLAFAIQLMKEDSINIHNPVPIEPNCHCHGDEIITVQWQDYLLGGSVSRMRQLSKQQ